jgi:hypothetical protein
MNWQQIVEHRQDEDDKQFGIDELRATVEFFDWCNESFNQLFTLTQLVRLRRYCKAHPELPEFPDSWDDDELEKAFGGKRVWEDPS